jgi:hypothetical protein
MVYTLTKMALWLLHCLIKNKMWQNYSIDNSRNHLTVMQNTFALIFQQEGDYFDFISGLYYYKTLIKLEKLEKHIKNLKEIIILSKSVFIEVFKNNEIFDFLNQKIPANEIEITQKHELHDNINKLFIYISNRIDHY